jgi:hypothetical protein
LDPEERLDMPSKKKQSTESAAREIRRRTRRKFAPEEKVRIVLEGLRGEQSISELCPATFNSIIVRRHFSQRPQL